MVIKHISIAILGLLTIIGASDMYARQSLRVIASNPFRTQLEEAMYTSSGQVFNKRKYKQFIAPFLNKAEKELKSIQFCMQNNNCVACDAYFDALVMYNFRSFIHYIKNDDRSNYSLIIREGALNETLNDLAQQGALKEDEVDTELQKIERIFLEGNKAYYFALPWYAKLSAWLSLH